MTDNPHTLPALHHRLLNSGLDRLEVDVPSHSLARARVGCFAASPPSGRARGWAAFLLAIR